MAKPKKVAPTQKLVGEETISPTLSEFRETTRLYERAMDSTPVEKETTSLPTLKKIQAVAYKTENIWRVRLEGWGIALKGAPKELDGQTQADVVIEYTGDIVPGKFTFTVVDWYPLHQN